ncbi:MAG: hypothetical protein BGO49_24600 [Planctomycetales bacterium 71-10]|nr:MAG: hypothetical protein BGO49_24600 [Planctomycetales bacterium 71-10]
MSGLLELYLAQPHFSPMHAGKLRKALLRPQRYSGGPVTNRAAYAESRVAAGNVKIDREKQRYEDTDTGYFYAFSDITLALVDYTEWLLSRKEAA